ALWRRLRMTGGDDSFVALKHVYSATHPDQIFDIGIYRGLRRECRDLVREHFPYQMSVRMLLKPLGLGPYSSRIALPALVALARRVVPCVLLSFLGAPLDGGGFCPPMKWSRRPGSGQSFGASWPVPERVM